jgi:hypothetical protein
VSLTAYGRTPDILSQILADEPSWVGIAIVEIDIDDGFLSDN